MGRIFDFIANTGDGAFAVDRHQSIVLWNGPATSIFGYGAREVLGKKCYGIVCGRDSRGCNVCRRGCRAIESAKRLEPPMTTEIGVQTKQGSEAWLSLSTVVVPSRRGDLSVLVHLFREVTQEHDVLRVARNLVDILGAPSRRKKPSAGSRLASRRATCVELTPREREILTLMASGFSTKAIAEELCISSRTVGNHVNNILGKLDVHSRLEAVTYSIKNGLV